MIGDPKCDRWRGAQRFVNAAEVVMGDVQGDGGNMVFQLLAETICQSRETPASHAQRQVSAFRVAGRNLCRDAAYYVAAYRDLVGREERVSGCSRVIFPSLGGFEIARF